MHNVTTAIRKFYNEKYTRGMADDSPDESRTRICRQLVTRIGEMAEDHPPVRVLHVGSGPQSVERELFESVAPELSNCPDVTFFTADFATFPAGRLLATSDGGYRRNNIVHLKADKYMLPCPDGSIDIVYSNHAIDLTGRKDALEEAHRVMANNGYGIFNFHHPSMLPQDFTAVYDPRVKKVWQYLAITGGLYASEDEILDEMGSLGFQDVNVNLASDGTDTWWEVEARK